MSFRDLAIRIIFGVALIAILLVGLPAMGVPIPGFVLTIAWIVGVAYFLYLAVLMLPPRSGPPPGP